MPRICAVQYALNTVASFEDFAAECTYYVQTAADYGSDFVLFPEMVTMQLLSATPGLKGEAAIRTLNGYTERYLQLFQGLAAQHRVHVIGGTHFTVLGDKAYNVAYFFQPNGEIGRQLKIHVTPGERQAWGIEPGREVEMFTTDHGRVAIQICYDIEFPETTRLAAEKGAEIVFVPFCTDDRQSYLRVRYCAQARCVENQIYVAAAGVVGNLRGVPGLDVNYAQSGIFTPSDFGFARDGIAAECPVNDPTVAVADVDLAVLARQRKAGTVRNWNDRRTDLYQIVTK